MPPPPNELYTAFSFIGVVFCAIPFYWHLEAWNTGTCLYMIWTGLGCLLQCINSIVWNKNVINRAPVYCDISTRIQVALNVAIPACSLCINRRLYKIAKTRAVVITDAQKRRALTYDLLIGIGIPILQIIAEYVVSANRYNIFEDFGPDFSMVNTPLTFVLFSAWPVAIGTISLFYCVMNIHFFYTYDRRLRQLMTSACLTRSRYIRLMVISTTEILGTIPLGTLYIVKNARLGIDPWRGWAYTHEHYSVVHRVPASIWKNNPNSVFALEMYRWSLVLCAFLFFALFGFADEARQHYRRVYTSIAGRIGYSTSTLLRSSQTTSSVPYMKSKGGITVTVAITGPHGDKPNSSVPLTLTNQKNSILIANDLEADFKVAQYYSRPESVESSSGESFDGPKMHGQSALPGSAGILPAVPPASVPPHFPDKTNSTLREYSFFEEV